MKVEALPVRSICSLLLCLSLFACASVRAEVGHCLSGGYASGYSCSEDRAYGSRKSVYSVQLLVNNSEQRSLLQQLQLPLLYSTSISEFQRFMYLGDYATAELGRNGLKAMEAQLGVEWLRYRPMLVSYIRDGDELPRIRLAEEAGAGAIPAGRANAVSGFNLDASEVLYAVQLAAFKTSKSLRAFLQKYPSYPLYCRRKDNGFYAAYLAPSGSYSQAKEALDKASTFSKLGPYVVELKGVNVPPCRS